MRAYKIRDSKTKEFFSENRTSSENYATVWYSLEELVRFLRNRENEEMQHRSVYSAYGEQFSGPLLPSTWQIVEVDIEEIASISLSDVLKQASQQ